MRLQRYACISLLYFGLWLWYCYNWGTVMDVWTEVSWKLTFQGLDNSLQTSTPSHTFSAHLADHLKKQFAFLLVNRFPAWPISMQLCLLRTDTTSCNWANWPYSIRHVSLYSGDSHIARFHPRSARFCLLLTTYHFKTWYSPVSSVLPPRRPRVDSDSSPRPWLRPCRIDPVVLARLTALAMFPINNLFWIFRSLTTPTSFIP